MVKRLQLSHLYEIGWKMLRRNTTASYFFGSVLITVFIVANHGLVFAWGAQCQKVIGYIAELNLSPEAKKYIVKEFNINNLADVAIWADIIRKKRKNERPWHYTNIKEGEWVYVRERDCPDSNCLVEKIKIFSKIVSDNHTLFIERRDALKYLVHFVGDVHQPLHLGNLKDRGGGRIRLFNSGKNVSLHYLWDGGLIDWEKENLVEYAAHLNSRVLDSEKSEWLSPKINEWANESRSLALKYAYSLEEGKLSKKYIKRGIEILNQRMVQAGVRLAGLLNQLFHSKK